MLSLRDIEAAKFGAPVDGEDLSVPGSSVTSKITRPAHSIVRLIAPLNSTVRYRVAYNPFKDGDFELIHTTWGKDANGDWDVAGNTLLKGGPWKENGTSGKVTLNKTSPLAGERDAKMDFTAAADCRLTQLAQWAQIAGRSYILGFTYKNSNAGNTLDYAISYLDAAGTRKWLQGGGGWGVENWFTAAGSAVLAYIVKAFTPEASLPHMVHFKPTGAAAENTQIDQVFFAECAIAGDALHPGGPELIIFEHEGRISGYSADAGPQVLSIATMK